MTFTVEAGLPTMIRGGGPGPVPSLLMLTLTSGVPACVAAAGGVVALLVAFRRYAAPTAAPVGKPAV